MDLVANVKLDSFMLEGSFQLNDLPCINENLEKTFQLHNLTALSYYMHVNLVHSFGRPL